MSTPGAGSVRPHVTVILPTYNEAGNIEDLIIAIRHALKAWDLELIVVDDNSPDETWRIAEIRSKTTPELRVIRRIGERGLTSAIQRGIRESRGSIICWLDCDFSQPPELLPALVSAVESRCDIAVGSRYVQGGSDSRTGTRLRIWLSSVITTLSSMLLVRDFRDHTSGFIAARRSVFEQISLRGDYGEYFIDLIFRAHRRGFRIVEIPYVCVPRRSGESKTESGMISKGMKYLGTVARLRWEALRGAC
ncbi:MAG: polyprenol monophosphomannose synthase [Planctomycetes bacterium]|nr:polyprenol monophosphomannose synthase [Planctomycetota bacterium]